MGTDFDCLLKDFRGDLDLRPRVPLLLKEAFSVVDLPPGIGSSSGSKPDSGSSGSLLAELVRVPLKLRLLLGSVLIPNVK